MACAEAGAAVSICARGAEALEKTKGEIAVRGITAHAAVCDLADAEAIADVVKLLAISGARSRGQRAPASW